MAEVGAGGDEGRVGAPKRIQRRRAKDWRMPEGTVYVGRPSRWGNPFRVGEYAPHRHRTGGHPYAFYIDHHRPVRAEQVVALYRRIVLEPHEHEYDGFVAPGSVEIRMFLAGKDLACWCPLDQPCHADVLLELANPAADLDAVWEREAATWGQETRDWAEATAPVAQEAWDSADSVTRRPCDRCGKQTLWSLCEACETFAGGPGAACAS